jgi:hypothetical protein
MTDAADLNLLAALDALLEDGGVTLAAKAPASAFRP